MMDDVFIDAKQWCLERTLTQQSHAWCPRPTTQEMFAGGATDITVVLQGEQEH